MIARTPITTLIELAERETDAAAKKLGAAIRAGEETEQKLALLHEYRNEYAARFQTGLSTGLSATGYRNFRAFLEKLDTAISGQQEIVRHAQSRIKEQRSAWQESERKRMSYNTLGNRAQTEEQRREARRDQKITDERAARQTLYRR
jgi:flagellar protein FliJ